MKTALIPVVILILLCGAIGWVGYQESDNIKALAGLGDDNQLYGRKSIIEDIACWIWPEKLAQYQRERSERAAKRREANIDQYESSLQALAVRRPAE